MDGTVEAASISTDDETLRPYEGFGPRGSIGAALIVIGQAPAAQHGRRMILFENELTIGRGGTARWRPSDSKISRDHACVTVRESSFVVEDRGSSNGTWLNDRRLRTSERARSGSLLFLGQHVAVLRLADRAAFEAIDEDQRDPVGPVWTLSPRLARFHQNLRRVARLATPVVIVGEPGTGKLSYARAIHARSGRSGPLVVLDCSALPGGSAGEAELARAISEAQRGTLFVDHVGDLPDGAQPVIMDLLTRWTPGKGQQPRIAPRIVLSAAGSAGIGRELLSLLASPPTELLRLPPLRQCKEDLAALIEELLPRPRPWFSTRAFRAICAYDWPLNLRELRMTVTLAAGAARQDSSDGGCGTVQVHHLPDDLLHSVGITPETAGDLDAAYSSSSEDEPPPGDGDRVAGGIDHPSSLAQFVAQNGLSPKESEVVTLAAVEALTGKEIAARMGLSVKTVETYWARIYEKTGLRSQRELLSALLRTAWSPEKHRS